MVDPANPAVCRDTGDDNSSARRASILEHATEAQGMGVQTKVGPRTLVNAGHIIIIINSS